MDNENSSVAEFTGKKVFFLYPTNSMVNQVITELAQHEFEVYAAKNHTRLEKVLKKYPDAIIFANIDEKMSIQEWERWINGIGKLFPNIKLGVFSVNNDEQFKEKFIKSNRISCGFLSLKNDMSKAYTVILEMLNILDVKGRRKYLRASVERETNVTLNMPLGGEFVNAVIKDISVVGISCVFNHDPALSKNAIIKDIQIKLHSMLIKAETVVFGSREAYGEKIYVLLFTQKIDPEVRVKIRKYIQQNLQNKMDMEIN
ncbi:MAG: pilus assembly protein PilZ [Treponema sp.]|nr:pilus assembly protein PilZ [Treponema sp.]